MVVQSGKQWEEINSDLAEDGIPLFFPLDPGPGATIGGMIGTGCSGTNACRYGTAKAEWILNVVSKEGERDGVIPGDREGLIGPGFWIDRRLFWLTARSSRLDSELGKI